MDSALYEGTIRHRRFAEHAHEFRHRVAMIYLDLGELDGLLDGRLTRSRAVVRFRRSDYLGDPRVPLGDAVRALVAERTGTAPCGPVRLLTHLRTFGHCFNPVSFYYCFAPGGERLEAIVAEVTSTPWRERHAYVLEPGAHDGRAVLAGSFEKALHVSPFMAMDQRYAWRALVPGPTLTVHIESTEHGTRAFDATLSLRRKPLDRRSLASMTLRDPAATQRMLVLIYAHAVALRLKGVRVKRRPRTTTTRAQAVARKVILTLAARIATGRLTVREAGRSDVVLGPGGSANATIEVRSPRVWLVIGRGVGGCVDSYLRGLWDSPDLAAVFRVAARNVATLDPLRNRMSLLRTPWLRLRSGFARNTPARARKDIAAHYDLGNELFALMLDPLMMYSCGVFEHRDVTLHAAQLRKLELVCEKLDLGPGDRVLEIGSGWGGFAVYAATTHGCHVTTTTISEQQHELATRRVHAAGVQDLVDVRRDDYRALSGSFDKLVSLEMIEAVGHRDFGTFFECCARVLAPHGTMLLQVITIDDRAYEVSKLARSFIRTYIFPNGCLPSQNVIADCLARRTDMRMVHLEDFSHHYAETLRRWRANFDGADAQIAKLGYDERFRRLWRAYLAYCEAGFEERRISLVQMVIDKPRHVRPGFGLSQAGADASDGDPTSIVAG
jgi:cyclopropane-fatty-acyl-phospholipid synthase